MSPLNRETIIGLTFGQIIGLASLFITIGVAWTNTQVEIARIKQDVVALKQYDTASGTQLETIRQENRQEHQLMMNKIDVLIEKLQR